MEVLCVSLLVQIFKIMFRWAASHEGLMMLYQTRGLCMLNDRGSRRWGPGGRMSRIMLLTPRRMPGVTEENRSIFT
jgi:hypothetical protein